MQDSERETLERLAQHTEQIKTLFEAIKNCVSKDRFWPVQLIAYGLAAITMSSVFAALVTLVLRKG